jgi:hypothetical protein
MISSSVKELIDAKAEVAQLEQTLAEELASLPAAYGFDSLKAFVSAIKAAGGKGRVGRSSKSGTPKPRKRATITDAVRAEVKALVKAGKTGSHIAKALGISLPSVQNIKKALGLVKSSKKTSPTSKARPVPAKVRAAQKAKKKPMTKKKALTSTPIPSSATAEPTSIPPA